MFLLYISNLLKIKFYVDLKTNFTKRKKQSVLLEKN